ncbi:MAG: response regulator, partial [Alphaproteobacteria bacterium]|nr:response regulator [Alphaproteobacteria bacterium]
KAEAISAREEAVKNSRAKTKFLAAASHDLRQPLNAMGFFIEALQQEQDPAEGHKLVDKINASATSLRDLLNALLDISRIESGILHPEWENFPIDRLLGHIADDYKLVFAEKNIDFSYVPSSAWVKSDSPMLERMVRNIIENALQHSARAKILLGCRLRGEMVSIEIRDQGPGIPLPMQEKIFEEFYQIDNPERDRRKGLGLGLAVVSGLSRELGHDINIWSEPGKGVCFKILVPGATEEIILPGEEIQADRTPPPNVTILIVDDDPASLDAMARMCCRWDYDVLAAGSLDQALDLIDADRRPDVIITDHRLQKGLTGSEAIDRIRRRIHNDCPAIIVTGDTAPERLSDAQKAGFPLLHKPVLPARLRATLQNITPD